MLIFDKYREEYQIVGYKQFDSIEPLKAQFFSNGEPINLSDYYIRLECKKPDGNIVIDDENITIKGTCEIEILLNEQVTIVNGNVKCQFVLVNKSNEKQSTTFTFEMDVQQSVIGISGYSQSTVTIAERLNKDIPIAKKIHEDLTSDISVGNQVKQELIEKTNIANTTINTLTEKTNNGSTVIDSLIEKTNNGNITIDNLIKKTNEGNITIDGLIEKINEGNSTNISLKQTTDVAIEKDGLLKQNTTLANASIDNLIEKTSEGNTTINELVSKNTLAIQTNDTLIATINDAIEKNAVLINTNLDADTINTKLEVAINSASDSIDKINATGNKSLIIGASQFINNEYTWTHNMNSEDLTVNIIDVPTKEPLNPDYKIVDKNNILIRNSAEHPNVKVILSSSCYQGNPLFGTTVEEFVDDNIESNGNKVRLKDGNGVAQNPITDSDAVFMADGTTKLTKKISDISTQLTEMMPKVDTWEDFKANGGEIGGINTLDQNGIGVNCSTGVEKIKITRTVSSGDYEVYMGVAGDGQGLFALKSPYNDLFGLVLEIDSNGGMKIRPRNNGQTDLGVDNYSFKDIFIGSYSKSTNGYTKLPNGLILQWGAVSVTGGVNGVEVILPITFNENYRLTVSPVDLSLGTTPITAWVTGKSNTQFWVRTTSKCSVQWMAIGW